MVIWKRHTAVMKAASPHFLIVILAGSLLPLAGIGMYGGIPSLERLILSWMLHTTTFRCHLRIWLMNIGFSVVYRYMSRLCCIS